MQQATLTRPSLLDELIPRPDHREFSSHPVRASEHATWSAVRAVTADEISLYRTLTWIRRFGFPTRYSSLEPPRNQPLLEAISRNEFSRLGETPGSEIVIGALILTETGEFDPHRWKAREFAAVNQPGFAKLAINFAVAGGAGRSTVSSETRVWATDRTSPETAAQAWRRAFRWSGFVRQRWLRAIASRAEAESQRRV
ncbi:MAG: hypothetical protein U0Q16_00890 [Bryobacteraceae bacterium]